MCEGEGEDGRTLHHTCPLAHPPIIWLGFDGLNLKHSTSSGASKKS